MPSQYQPADLLARSKTKVMRDLMTLLIEQKWHSELHDGKLSFRHPLSGSEFVTPEYISPNVWNGEFYWAMRGIKVLLVAYRGRADDLRASLMLRWGGVPWVIEPESELSYKKAMIYVAEEWPRPNMVAKPQS